MSDSCPLADDSNSAEDSDNESVNILRELVEKLSTSGPKVVSRKTLLKLLEMCGPSILDPLEACLTDGCRIIRQLPTRSLPEGDKDGSCPFKFQVPHSMRCITSPGFSIKEVASERKIAEAVKSRWSEVGAADKAIANNKKRKSARTQAYLKREAETNRDDLSRSDDFKETVYGSEEDGFSSDKKGSLALQDHRSCNESSCEDNEREPDDIEVPRRFWFRRKEERLPFSHEEKAKRLVAIKARCRERRMTKAQEAHKVEKDQEGNDIEAFFQQSQQLQQQNEEAEKRGQKGKKPSRGERRTAALRKETTKTKSRPTLAELRARVGKGSTSMPGKEEETSNTDIKQVVDFLHTLPPNGKSTPPTCEFTFTSRSMATNRLVTMRAELEGLHKNLKEAKREFEDLRRLESEVAKVPGASTTGGGGVAVKASHDKLLQSVNHLSATCKKASSAAATVTAMATSAQKPGKVEEGGRERGKTLSVESLKPHKEVEEQRRDANSTISKALTVPVMTSQAASATSSTGADNVVSSSKPIMSPPQQQHKSPPPLSRRKKANMANIHHISNHRPSRQLSSEGGSSGRAVIGGHHHQQPLPESITPGMDHPTTTSCLFADEWMCVFCEYRLLYGEYPRMMGAVKSRKKLIVKKKDAQDRAHRATTVGAAVSTKSRAQCTCGRAHAKAMQAVAKEFGNEESAHDYHHHEEYEDDHHHHHHHYHDHHQSHNHAHDDHHHHHHNEEQATSKLT